MYLVTEETETYPYTVCLIKRKKNKKTPIIKHVWVRKEIRKKMCQRTKKRQKEILSGGGGERRAQRALWDQLTNISPTLAGANQHLSPEWPEVVVMYRDPISSYRGFFSWILAVLPVSGRDTESGWMKEDDGEVGLRVHGWTVGEKVKEKEKEKDVDKRENET